MNTLSRGVWTPLGALLGILILPAPDAQAGVKDLHLSDSDVGKVWPGCMALKTQFNDKVDIRRKHIWSSVSAEFVGSRSINTSWGCPVAAPWKMRKVTITDVFKVCAKGLKTSITVSSKIGGTISISSTCASIKIVRVRKNSSSAHKPDDLMTYSGIKFKIPPGAVHLTASHQTTAVWDNHQGYSQVVGSDSSKSRIL